MNGVPECHEWTDCGLRFAVCRRQQGCGLVCVKEQLDISGERPQARGKLRRAVADQPATPYER